MKRYSDEMTIDTEVGKGTTVTVKIKVSERDEPGKAR